MKYVSYENHLKAAAEGGLEGDRKALHYVPHDYQAYATEFILAHPVAAILLQMGLGKSVITLTAIRELLDRAGNLFQHLIIEFILIHIFGLFEFIIHSKQKDVRQ